MSDVDRSGDAGSGCDGRLAWHEIGGIPGLAGLQASSDPVVHKPDGWLDEILRDGIERACAKLEYTDIAATFLLRRFTIADRGRGPA